MLGGSVSVILLFLINAAFRGAGDAAITMRTLWLANGINIVLGPLFVFGLGPFPRLGVTGAAVATTIGRGIGVLYQLRALARGRGRLAVRRAHLAHRPRRRCGRSSASPRTASCRCSSASPAGSAWCRSWRRSAASALAGYTHRHAGRDVRAPAVVGARQRGGDAGRTEPGRRATRRAPSRRSGGRRSTTSSSWAASASCSSLFGDGIVRLFTPDADGRRRRAAAACASWRAGFPFYAYGMVVTQAFNGAGDTRTPTWINLGCFWLGEIPPAFLLAQAARHRADRRLRGDHRGVLGDGGRLGDRSSGAGAGRP